MTILICCQSAPSADDRSILHDLFGHGSVAVIDKPDTRDIDPRPDRVLILPSGGAGEHWEAATALFFMRRGIHTRRLVTAITALKDGGIADFWKHDSGHTAVPQLPLGAMFAEGDYVWQYVEQKDASGGIARVKQCLFTALQLNRFGYNNGGSLFECHFEAGKMGGRKTISFTRADLSGGRPWSEFQARLMNAGFEIFGSSGVANRMIDQWIKEQIEDFNSFSLIDRIGWNDDFTRFAFDNVVLTSSGAVDAICGTGVKPAAMAITGTLEGWKAQVGSILERNTVGLIALGTALAAPMTAAFGMHNVCIHLEGAPGGGKTVMMNAALSAWYRPTNGETGCAQPWDGTIVGHMNIMKSINGLPYGLDEMTKVAKTTSRSTVRITDMTYAIGNGTSVPKGRSATENVEQHQFRLSAISTGEFSVSASAEMQGTPLTSGGDARLLNLFADEREHRVFDDPAPHTTFHDAGRAMMLATKRENGTAGARLVEHMLADMEAAETRFTVARNTFTARFSDGESDDVRRQVERHWSSIYGALLLAHDAGVIDKDEDAIMTMLAAEVERWKCSLGDVRQFGRDTANAMEGIAEVFRAEKDVTILPVIPHGEKLELVVEQAPRQSVKGYYSKRNDLAEWSKYSYLSGGRGDDVILFVPTGFKDDRVPGGGKALQLAAQKTGSLVEIADEAKGNPRLRVNSTRSRYVVLALAA
ncbi:MAG: DUF927 domain-containing protein [Notoacmeibacter sp.]|nr:DUF927 domain-containing protein [Notoacmeibacter sp.]